MVFLLNKKNIIFFILILVFISILTYHNYLLFHSYVEGFSVVISSVVFIITWNSKKYIKNNFLLIVGISYLFIAHLDLLHTLSYKGMNIFTDYDYYANQLWIATRFLSAVSLLVGSIFLKTKKIVNTTKTITTMTIYTIFTILTIFVFKIFPICFIEGQGQTTFKLVSEYIIISILILTIYVLHKHRESFSKRIYSFLMYSIILSALSELAFTFYISNYGFSNIVGHYLKIFSFILVYLAIIETAIKNPYNIIFKELDESKRKIETLYNHRKKMFRIIGHDLRSPFSALIGFSELLLMNIEDNEVNNTEEQEELIRDINITARKTYQFLENLLDWASFDETTYSQKFEVININSLLDEFLVLYENIAKNKYISVIKEFDQSELLVEADKKMLLAIIRNIVSNAIKFTKENGIIKFSTKVSNEKVILEVQDNGIGMSESQLKNLFSEYKEIVKGTANESSHGIGTSIIKEFSEKNNIDLKVYSEKDKGTRFSLSFKIYKGQ